MPSPTPPDRPAQPDVLTPAEVGQYAGLISALAHGAAQLQRAELTEQAKTLANHAVTIATAVCNSCVKKTVGGAS